MYKVMEPLLNLILLALDSNKVGCEMPKCQRMPMAEAEQAHHLGAGDYLSNHSSRYTKTVSRSRQDQYRPTPPSWQGCRNHDKAVGTMARL